MEDASASVGGGRHAATPPRSQRDPPPLAQSRRVGHRQDGHPARALIVSVGLRPGLPTGRSLALSLAISDKSTAVSRPDHTCQPTPIDPVAFPALCDERYRRAPLYTEEALDLFGDSDLQEFIGFDRAGKALHLQFGDWPGFDSFLKRCVGALA
jgi:hypothetical protein